MLSRERRRRILSVLHERGSVENTELLGELKVSAMTLWRDLKSLEERGLIRRVHGGAVRIDARMEPAFEDKETLYLNAKRRIASAAANLVESGQVLFMEGGTTVAELVSHLPEENLTVLTNSIRIMARVHASRNKLQMNAVGGMMSPLSGNLVGREAITSLSGKKADIFFMSATGVSSGHGITDPNSLEVEVKQAMAERAKKVVLLADASKIGRRSLIRVLPFEKVDVMITDSRASPVELEALEKAGLKLMIV